MTTIDSSLFDKAWETGQPYVPQAMDLSLKQLLLIILGSIAGFIVFVVCIMLFVCGFCVPSMFKCLCGCVSYVLCLPCKLSCCCCDEKDHETLAAKKTRKRGKSKDVSKPVRKQNKNASYSELDV